MRRYSLGLVALFAGTAMAVGEWQRNPPDAHGPADPHAAPAAAPAAKPAAKPTTPPPAGPAAAKPTTPPPVGGTKAPAAKPAVAPAPKPAEAPAADTPSGPDEALKWLQEGNERWSTGLPKDPNTSDSRRKSVAGGQKPFASILTCADSRIPAERVFDRGVGDLFVIRVAGNPAGPHEAGTIEYGAEHLNIPLLVVMGHTKCGAVAAACSHAHVEGNVASLITAVEPAVARAEKLNPNLKDAELVSVAVKENVWQSIFDLLKSSEVCRERVGKGELRIVGAVYDISSGQVEWMGEHPWQSELIAAFTPATTSPAATPTAEASEPADAHH